MAVFFFFIDGFGIGKKSKTNPIYCYGLWKDLLGLKTLVSLSPLYHKNFFLLPLDASLGVEGTPQSATGQTALFTGINAPSLIGGHLTGFPGEKLTEVIEKHSFLKKLREKGFLVVGANAYSQQYFERVKKGEAKLSASTLAIQASGIDFKMLADLQEKNAVFMDIDHHILKTRYPEIKKRNPVDAAKTIIKLCFNNHLVFFEYFWTDYVGHKGNKKERKRIIKTLNTFLKYIVKNMNMRKNVVIICSDHGNFEDAIYKKHTENPVPLLIFTKNQLIKKYFASCKNIADVPVKIITGFEKGILR